MADLNLIVTIDTEEDDWADYRRTPASISNIERIPDLQRLFDEFRVKPTYLVSYPIAESAAAVSIFGDLLKDDRCEVGAHCHPWNTPPFDEEINAGNSMLCNLPAPLQYRKLSALHNLIVDRLGVVPAAFRAGRWGFDNEVAKNIARLGYTIDTSITPFTDWGEFGGPDFSGFSPRPWRLELGGDTSAGARASLFEIPPSIGFNRENFERWNKVYQLLRREPVKRVKIIGLLHKLNIMKKVWLSPELSTLDEMIALSKVMMENNYGVLNMTFHSPSLQEGLSPFVRTRQESRRFLEKIERYLSYMDGVGIQSVGISDLERCPPAKTDRIFGSDERRPRSAGSR